MHFDAFRNIFAIIFALYIEYYLNYKPCKLCLYQRVPFILVIFISFVGYYFSAKDEILVLLITIFLVGLIISGYHFGIEKGFFEEFKGCTNDTLNITDKADLRKSLEQTMPSCKEISFTFFEKGLALSGLFFCILLLIQGDIF